MSPAHAAAGGQHGREPCPCGGGDGGPEDLTGDPSLTPKRPRPPAGAPPSQRSPSAQSPLSVSVSVLEPLTQKRNHPVSGRSHLLLSGFVFLRLLQPHPAVPEQGSTPRQATLPPLHSGHRKAAPRPPWGRCKCQYRFAGFL